MSPSIYWGRLAPKPPEADGKKDFFPFNSKRRQKFLPTPPNRIYSTQLKTV